MDSLNFNTIKNYTMIIFLIIFIGLIAHYLFLNNKEDFHLKQDYGDYAEYNPEYCSTCDNCDNCQFYDYDHERVDGFDKRPIFRKYCGYRLIRPN